MPYALCSCRSKISCSGSQLRGIGKMTIYNFNKRLPISSIPYQLVHWIPSSSRPAISDNHPNRNAILENACVNVASHPTRRIWSEFSLIWIIPVISRYLRLILTRCRYQGGFLVSRFKEVEENHPMFRTICRDHRWSTSPKVSKAFRLIHTILSCVEGLRAAALININHFEDICTWIFVFQVSFLPDFPALLLGDISDRHTII